MLDPDPRGNPDQEPELDPDAERRRKEELQESGKQLVSRTNWAAVEEETDLPALNLEGIKSNWKGGS